MGADIDKDPGAAEHRYRVIAPCGELNAATTAVLRFDLNGWGSREGAQRLVVDLSAVTFMDASVLRILCTAHGRADREGGWLRLVYTVPRIGTLLAATRLDVRFPCHATVADALAGRTCPAPRRVRMPDPAPGERQPIPRQRNPGA
ncbi:STAS domain-containing protein [Streptacidiphilus sp. PB12-B1b]|uniref:STAS domain-containing protein n=1 Tax=Streptacidiphilus sp. PB12-B1b TaxID=2705012 RepID=UPI0015FBC14C|nr:STAS domain-containing protein [Streptacidiphilus sp. PB12-B1b]QMU76876.1 STAS domain-containing protein [Streptacidiphilus sp. PB12-B1b]